MFREIPEIGRSCAVQDGIRRPVVSRKLLFGTYAEGSVSRTSSDESNRIAGLEVKADGYLLKTLSTRELLARSRAVLRHFMLTENSKSSTDWEATVSVGDLWIDPSARKVRMADRPLALTLIEYNILLTLARAVGRVKTREQLLLEVAERDFEAFDRSVDVHGPLCEKKPGDDPKIPRYIETIRSVGYRMRRPEGE